MNHTVVGNALHLPYADGIAQTCVTSPPYYGLRDYGTARWEGGDAGCDHAMRPDGGPKQLTSAGAAGHVHRNCKCGARRIDLQIGLEQTPAAYVAQIVAAMREVWRVLRDDGTLWLNLGDSYASTAPGTRNAPQQYGNRSDPGQWANMRPPLSGNLKPKDLIGIPWRVAFALQDDGWYLRSDIIWSKANPMPESVTDRPTKAHEYVFLLAKQPRYYYDAEAIAESSIHAGAVVFNNNGKNGQMGDYGATRTGFMKAEGVTVAATRNARSVWAINTQPFSGAHFATMPPELARRCILAGTSARGQCPKCGAPWVRVVERTGIDYKSQETIKTDKAGQGVNRAHSLNGKTHQVANMATNSFAPSCECGAGDPVPQIVLDPFSGSGTTAMCALQAGRRAIGTELNPAYIRLQEKRTQVTMGLGL